MVQQQGRQDASILVSAPTQFSAPLSPSPSLTNLRINTSLNRHGSRVLSKRIRPTNARNGTDDSTESKPERTRKVKRVFGTGEAGDLGSDEPDSSETHDVVYGQAYSSDPWRETDPPFPFLPRPASSPFEVPLPDSGDFRRRNTTWTQDELEEVVSPRPPLRPFEKLSSESFGSSQPSSGLNKSSSNGSVVSRNSLLRGGVDERRYSAHTSVEMVQRAGTPLDFMLRQGRASEVGQPRVARSPPSFVLSSAARLPPKSFDTPYSPIAHLSTRPTLSIDPSLPNRHHSYASSDGHLSYYDRRQSAYSSADVYSPLPSPHAPFHSSNPRSSVPRHGSSASEFSSHTFGNPPLDPRTSRALEELEKLENELEQEVIARPIEWLARLDSSGTLPERGEGEGRHRLTVRPFAPLLIQGRVADGGLQLANPDSDLETARPSQDDEEEEMRVPPAIVRSSFYSQDSL